MRGLPLPTCFAACFLCFGSYLGFDKWTVHSYVKLIEIKAAGSGRASSGLGADICRLQLPSPLPRSAKLPHPTSARNEGSACHDQPEHQNYNHNECQWLRQMARYLWLNSRYDIPKDATHGRRNSWGLTNRFLKTRLISVTRQSTAPTPLQKMRV